MKHLLTIVLLIAFAGNRLQAAPGFTENRAAGTKDPSTTGTTIPVTVSADNQGVLTCAVTALTLYASTPETGVSYHWTSTNGFESDLPNPTITVTGTYTVKVTNASGSGKASITITEYKTCPDVTASGSSLSCLPQAALSASSKVPNAQYSWVGPYYFTSTLQRPTVVDAGTYTVTVTDPSNGCYTSRSVEVASAPSSTLWAASFTVPDGTTRIDTGRYQWTATHTGTAATRFSPKNYEFRAGNIGVGKEGIWASQPINIAGKANVGIAVHVRSYAASGGQFEADTTSMGDYLRLYYKLDGGTEVLFAEKTGAINNNYENYTTVSTRSLSGSTIQIIIRARTTEADEYYYFDNVTVTGANGINIPLAVSGNSTLTCTNSTVTLNGTSSAAGLIYSWTGPNDFTANTFSTSVTKGGTYTLTVTDPANGCTTSASTTVEENTVIPGGLSINNTSSLTCLNKSVKVYGFSTTPNARYVWTGPNGFSATSSTITAIRGGAYTLKVTDTINGCSDSVGTTVIDNSKPPVVTITNNSPLSCSNRTVTLSATTATPNAAYLWLGPDDFFDETNTTTTYIPGSYSVIVSVPATGCQTTEFTEVTGDITACGRLSTGSGNTATANAQNAAGEVITKFVYKAYPNPVTLNGIIEFATPESATVTVGLYNSLGVCEKVLFKGNAAAQQRYRLAVPAAPLQAGAYYYIINTGGRSYTGKLVIMR